MPKYHAKKSLGQNFLVDVNARTKIVQACGLTKEDTVIEIGPGQGALTALIAPCVKRLIVVEKDKDLIPGLEAMFAGLAHVEIKQADFLTWDMAQINEKVYVIGNIPYYISTPILERILAHREMVKQAWLTVQWEFAKRVVAKAGNKEYGSLSCFVQYYMNPSILFKISKGCFNPKPSVDSAFLSLPMKPRIEPKVRDEAKLFNLIQRLFMQRRKTLLNALSAIIPKAEAQDLLKDLSIASQRRPETLELIEFISIAQHINHIKLGNTN